MNFKRFAGKMSAIAGSPAFFIASAVLTLLWLLSGFWLQWSDTWNFWANTSTTVLTWLLAILVLYTQNRDAKALHLKLDALLIRLPDAPTEVAHAEEQDDAELARLKEAL